ncbi:MAG: hypothetical protein NTW19_15220 [Planctomycetota bacterium]|nr:hypothetical protein [Planctomycetota bacterium]
MNHSIYIGASVPIDIAALLHETAAKFSVLCPHAQFVGVSATEFGTEGRECITHGMLGIDGPLLELWFGHASSRVVIISFETEEVPGYEMIRKPITISIGVWVGAENDGYALAACAAAAIATIAGSSINDDEQIWSAIGECAPDEFMGQAALTLQKNRLRRGGRGNEWIRARG